MAPARVSAPTYSTRRKKQLPASRSTAASPDEVVSTTCGAAEKYSNGCVLHSAHDDAGDTLGDAFLPGKGGDGEGRQDHNTGNKPHITAFSRPSTMCQTATTEPSTDSPPVSVHVEQGERIFQRLRTTPLLCARPVLEPCDALETMPLDGSTQGVPPGMCTTKSPTEDTSQREASPKISDGHTDFPEFLTNEASAQKTDTRSNEAPPDETGRHVCRPTLPDDVEEKAMSQGKISTDMHEETLAELRASFDKEIERELCTKVSDELLLPEVAAGVNDGLCASKKRRCSTLPSTPATGRSFSEGSNANTPPALVSLHLGVHGGDSTENSTTQRVFSDRVLDTPAMESGTVCPPVAAKDVLCKKEDPVKPPHKPTPQQTAAKRLSAVSLPSGHVETFASSPAEEAAHNQKSRAEVQQNATTLIKRRRCGSLGLDQSLRWQAMARRVPRIKGVCYSTTRHEWIAVGPLQAGSARKKNIYFSVPKHGFEGARRLAVECRRRLQAGVPVNVQEFVREQQLLFQREATASEPADVATSTSGGGSLAEKIPSVDSHQAVGSPAPVAPHSLPEKHSASTRGHLADAASQAQGCNPENASTPPSSARRRRSRALTFRPLQRDITQKLFQGEEGIEEAHENGKKQCGTQIQSDSEARDPSQVGFLKAPWHCYSAKENSLQAHRVNKRTAPRESDTPPLAHVETLSEETPTRVRSTDGLERASEAAVVDADVSADPDRLGGGPTCRKGTYAFERGGTMGRASTSDESAFSISTRLATVAEQRALDSDESASAAALLSSDAFMTESGCTWSTGRVLQLWASALSHTTQADGQTTEHSKLCTQSEITSALPAALTAANGEKICSSKDVCTPFPAGIRRSISFNKSTAATPPETHLPFPKTGFQRTKARVGKGGLKQHQHAFFFSSDNQGRRSSTASSAGSRSAGMPSLSETNCENPESSYAGKESSDDSDREKHSRKPWRGESFCEDALITGKSPQFERERFQKENCPGAGNQRYPATLALSLASENADASGETAATDMICSPSNGHRSLIDLLNPAETLLTEGAVDPKRNHLRTSEDDSTRGNNTNSDQTINVRERADAVVYSSTRGLRAIGEGCHGKSLPPSLPLGNAFNSTATLDCPATSDYSCLSTSLERSEQTSGVSHTVSGPISLLQEMEKKNTSCHEVDVLEDADVLLGDSDVGTPSPQRGSVGCAPASDKEGEGGERDTGGENLTERQTMAAEISPLVKALCLMLVDLLRFCSCSPTALARAGLQPCQIAFCKNEGVRVLRTALQDVSATRTVSRRFRAYLEIFEDSILANALPTSGGRAEIICYLYRVKQVTEGRARRPGHAEDDTPPEEIFGGLKSDSGAVKLNRSHESCTARDNHVIDECCAVRCSYWPTYERTKCPTGNEVCATPVTIEEPDEPSSLQVQEVELAPGNGKAPKVKNVFADLNGLLNTSIAPGVVSWHVAQRNAEVEAEQRRCIREEALIGQRRSAFEGRCVEAYKESAFFDAYSTQSDDEKTHPQSVRLCNIRRANIVATNDTARGFRSSEKCRTTDCPESPDVASGQGLPSGRAAEFTCEIISSYNKRQKGNGEMSC